MTEKNIIAAPPNVTSSDQVNPPKEREVENEAENRLEIKKPFFSREEEDSPRPRV